MATRRVIKSVLGNFLGSYISRNSDFDGYWLFGFLVADLGNLKIDLLDQQGVADSHSPIALAMSSAVAKFGEQRRKAGLAASHIRNASLTIQRFPGSESHSINGRPREGFKVRFLAEAVMVNGRHYEKDRIAFVAPHDPHVELRSARISG
jgi:hypothetical protein